MDTRRAAAILAQEQELLLAFEAATQEMLTCAVDHLEGEMGKREKLLAEIQTREGQRLLDAAKGRSEVETLPEDYREIYRQGQEIRTVLSRFPESEVQARLRLRLEQEQMLKRIKAANQGSAAKASRFYSAGSSTGGGSRLGRA